MPDISTLNLHPFVYDWAEIAHGYSDVTEKGHSPSNSSPHMDSCIRSTWNTSWSGVDSAGMREYIVNGYETDATVDASQLPSAEFTRNRSKVTDDPEGEFQYDLFVMGETEYFRARVPRKQRAGIKVKFAYTFAGGVSITEINQYGMWLADAVRSIMSHGYDVELSCFSVQEKRGYVKGLPREYDGTWHEIVLSRFGQNTHFRDFSALFSPGGYRHLMFYTWCRPEQDEGWRTSSGFSYPPNYSTWGWDVEYDSEEREITVWCDYAGRNRFNPQTMTDKLESLAWNGR